MPSPAPGGAAKAGGEASHVIERRSNTEASACSRRSEVSFPPPTKHMYRPRNTHDAWPARGPGPDPRIKTFSFSFSFFFSSPSRDGDATRAYSSSLRIVQRPVSRSSAYASSKHLPEAPAPPRTSNVARAEADLFVSSRVPESTKRSSSLFFVSSNASFRAHTAAATCSARGVGARLLSRLSSSSCLARNKPNPPGFRNVPKNPLSLSPSYAVRHESARMSNTRASLRNRRFSSSPPNTTINSVPGTTHAVWPRRRRGTVEPCVALVCNKTNVAVSAPVVSSYPKSIRETSSRSVSSSLRSL